MVVLLGVATADLLLVRVAMALHQEATVVPRVKEVTVVSKVREVMVDPRNKVATTGHPPVSQATRLRDSRVDMASREAMEPHLLPDIRSGKGLSWFSS